MNKNLLACLIAATCATSAFAMSEGEYRTERMRLKESYSFRFVDCNALEGREKRTCASNIRTERDAAIDKLDARYKATKKEG